MATSWKWQPQSLNLSSQTFFWLTQTATAPWAAFTGLFFLLLLGFLLKLKTNKQWISLVLVIGFSVLVGQGIKSTIKTMTAESRPFVLWIEEKYSVDDEYFYSLPRAERKALIEQYIYQSPDVPNWLYKHWCNETGYAFPSGHVLFSTTLAFIALLFLNYRRYYGVIALFVIWAILVEISRLVLGMHHPIDVVLGAFIAWILSLSAFLVASKLQLLDRDYS
ncbi:phosphatase PAP2 family protein [Orbaceae bacterium ac157xtp]